MENIVLSPISISDLEALITASLKRVIENTPPTVPQKKIKSLDEFCELGYTTLGSARVRLSKNGKGIPGAHKFGGRWYINMEEFEAELSNSN